MKILIDDGLALGKKLTGIGWYTKEVYDALKKTGMQVELKSYPTWFHKLPRVLKRFLYLAFFVKRNVKADYNIVFYTNFYVPAKKHKAKVVVTIHDLSPFFVPETFPFRYRHYAKQSVINSLKQADIVITVSESVNLEIKEMYPSYHHKVKVVFNSVRESYLNDQKDISQKKNFFLYVGVIEKRKNIELLCRAFEIFKKKHVEAELVIVGKPGYGFEEISRGFHGDGIVYKSYIDDFELQDLYRGAKAFVFPSLYEGFGKPVVEAMFYQLPIIASDIPTNFELNNRHNRLFYIFGRNNISELVTAMENIYHKKPQFYYYPNLHVYKPDQVSENLLSVVNNI